MILLLFLLVAVFYDVRQGIIPNRLILFGVCMGLAIEYVTAGWGGATKGILNCIVTIMILFILFVTKAVGAGDIKLYSLISIYMGIRKGLLVFVISILLAGIYIIISTIIHFNSFNVVQGLATTVSNFFIAGNFQKRTRYEKCDYIVHSTIKMTPYILAAFVITVLV